MKVDIAAQALREIERIDAWWHANRNHQELFKEELTAAEEFLTHTPELAPVYVIRRRRKVRRLLLRKTGVQLYFWVDEKHAVVHIVSAWGGRRGRGPKL